MPTLTTDAAVVSLSPPGGTFPAGARIVQSGYSAVAGTYRQCRSGAFESGVGVSNLVPHSFNINVGGTDRDIVMSSFSLSQSVGTTPTKCTFEAYGWEPQVGNTVYISDDGNTRYIFAGTIVHRTARIQKNFPVIWDCEALDWQWLLDKHSIVEIQLLDVGANVAVNRVLSQFTDPAAGFAAGSIPEDLGNVDLELQGIRVSQAMHEIATSVGALWNVTPDKHVNIFTEYPDANSLELFNNEDAASSVPGGIGDQENVQYGENLSQTRNRLICEGGGTRTTAQVEPGATEVPVEETINYIGGTQARAGHMRFSFSGVSANSGPGNLTGCSGITARIPLGTEVPYSELVEDATSQSDIASRLGGGLSGVLLHRVTQTRSHRTIDDIEPLYSAAHCRHIAEAELEVYKDPLESLKFSVRDDRRFFPGKIVSSYISSPVNAGGSFRIQNVRVIAQGDRSDFDSDESALIRIIDARPVVRRTVTNLLA